MAIEEERLEPLRRVLEHVRDRVDFALKQLQSAQEIRSLRWRCTQCGYVKAFTRPMPAHVAPPCPKCKGAKFERG